MTCVTRGKKDHMQIYRWDRHCVVFLSDAGWFPGTHVLVCETFLTAGNTRRKNNNMQIYQRDRFCVVFLTDAGWFPGTHVLVCETFLTAGNTCGNGNSTWFFFLKKIVAWFGFRFWGVWVSLGLFSVNFSNFYWLDLHVETWGALAKSTMKHWN
jgi:hypothetical protein